MSLGSVPPVAHKGCLHPLDLLPLSPFGDLPGMLCPSESPQPGRSKLQASVSLLTGARAQGRAVAEG